MKRVLCTLLVLFCVSAVFGKTYSEYLVEAKKYEEQKRWCYALGSYYDAMGTDELPENKIEAYEGYKKLKDSIVSGNPGLGKYNLFTIHDEWKNLLIDAEKYGSSISIYDITVGELEQGDLDYKTRTATYTAKIDYCLGDRFNKTIHIIEEGYKSAYKKDWTDLPEEWPLYSASSKKDKTYNVDGTLIYARSDWRNKHYINAFYYFEGKQKYGTGNTIWVLYETVGLYDYKFNIVDENGKELVKGKRWLLGDGNQISISGITPEVMDLIDNGKAFINPVGCYLQYGEYNKDDDKGGRTFMKNFPEVQLSMDKVMVICWNNKTDKIYKNFVSTVEYKAINNLEMININDLQIQVLKTEVTQALYVAVMGENPSYFEVEDLPVEQVSWYDAIYFCNKLSELKGFTSVYSVDGNSNTTDWNYTPHNGDSIKGTIEQNEFADGFRLPTEEEWVFAAKGGEQYNFAGSNNPDEVGWYGKLSDIDDVYIGNSGNKTHSVAQKKANAYGLYDMVGNVSEWCGDGYVICGSNWNTYVDLVGIDYREKPYSRSITDDRKGLRVVRSSPEQIAEKQRLLEQRAFEIQKRNHDIINNLELVNIPGLQVQMLKTEVTQALYQAVIGENPSYYKGDDLPVEQVSWYDAIYFCNKLSEMKGLTPVYSVNGVTNTCDWNYVPHEGSFLGTVEQNELADGLRLPTDDEWVYSAKGGDNYQYSDSNDPDEFGWYDDKTHTVAQKKANDYGLFDMLGNVSEWCWNSWLSERFIRQGLFGSSAWIARKPNIHYRDTGFRIVCTSSEQIAEKQRIAEELIRQEEFSRQEEERKKVETQRIIEEQRIAEERRNAEIKKMNIEIINSIEFISINDLQIQMSKTEITQALYKAVLGENPSYHKGDDLPVEQVSWYDAIYFCNRLSEIKGFTPAYLVDGKANTADWDYSPNEGEVISGTIVQDELSNGFRLPTEKEWEFAAKGGEDYKFSGSNDINEVGWYSNNSDKHTHPVAQKKANGYGLYDMTGNVWEWCWDREINWWGGTKCIIRSGSWYSGSDTCRISYRYNNYGPSERYENLGFRIVRFVFE